MTLVTLVLLAAAPAAEANCHECVDAAVDFADCTSSAEETADVESCGDEYVNDVLFHDH